MTNRERCIDFIAKHSSIATIITSREAGEELADLYFRLTGQVVRCSGCANEALVAYNSILNYINRDSNQEHPLNKGRIMSQYKLKKDALVYCQSMNRHFNQSTMTDEMAVAAIAENENNLQYFDEYPSDYMKDVDAFLAAKSDEQSMATGSEGISSEEVEEVEEESTQAPGQTGQKRKRK